MCVWLDANWSFVWAFVSTVYGLCVLSTCVWIVFQITSLLERYINYCKLKNCFDIETNTLIGTTRSYCYIYFFLWCNEMPWSALSRVIYGPYILFCFTNSLSNPFCERYKIPTQLILFLNSILFTPNKTLPYYIFNKYNNLKKSMK